MRRLPTRWAVALAIFVSAGAAAAEPGDFFFKKGDRVVFLGDSITEQYQYSTYLELYLTTRFPDWNLTFINAGIGGDTATGGAKRFAEHVLAEKPTCVTIDFGMNDGGYGAFDKGRNEGYVKNTDAMLQAAKEAGVRVALISPNAVETDVKPNLKTYLETQREFYAPLKGLAEKYQLPYVDQYAVTRETLAKIDGDTEGVKAALQKIGPDNGVARGLLQSIGADPPVKAFPDGVHTNPGGALLMAHTILVGLHAPPLVADLEIDAAAKKAGKAMNCKADKIEGGAEGVSFERTDDALPLAVQKDWVSMLPYVDQLKDLNDYGLKVSGLKDGKYTLSIDGKEAGTYSAADLASGVNLGNLESGPIFDQGQAVFKAIQEKNQLLHSRFNDVVRKPAAVGEAAKRDELKRRMDEIDLKEAAIYKLAQPKAHQFEVKAAK